MMDGFFVGVSAAFYLGILTAISPCPLATNIAAISYIGRRLENPRQVLLTGILYTLGRTVTYLVLGVLIVASILSMPAVSHFLEKYMNRALGPILIVAGMFLLGLLGFTSSGPGMSAKMQKRIKSGGLWGAGLLGMLFALSFCPVSAALFFGSLIPLAVAHHSRLVIPAIYGIATGLPVLVFAVLIATGARRVGAAFDRLTAIELWARRITGAAFVLVGILYSLTYIFGVPVLG
ncbi:MAG: aromatic aminobenezylarsenical efflux permease ArsG family transporter [Candidatus Krumholzibacteriia bacterium]